MTLTASSRRLGPLCLCLALSAASASAAAQPAAELLRRAEQAYATANFERSMRLLRRAAGQTSDPRLLGRVQLYLGANQATMGQRQQARRAFHQALVNDPALRMDPARFKRSTVQLFLRVRGAMEGVLHVTADRRGKVFVDGRLAGPTPRRIRLGIGMHRIEVRGADGLTWKEGRVIVGHGLVTTFSARALVAPSPDPTTAAPQRPASAPPRRHRLWTWISAGATVAALGAASGLTLAAGADHNDYMDAPTEERAAGFKDSGKTKQLAGGVLFGLAGALAVTSVILYLVEGRALDEEPEPTGAVARRSRRRSMSTGTPRIGLLLHKGAGLAFSARF